MKDILEQDYLNIKSEMVLFKALSEWGVDHPEEAERLMRLVRFSSMTLKQVEKCWDLETEDNRESLFDEEDIEQIEESVSKKDPALLPEGDTF